MKKINLKKIINEFKEDGYTVVKNFFSKKECNKFMKIISKYAQKSYAPIMNPDRIEFLILQANKDVIDNKKYLGKKADNIERMKRDCDYFRSF